MNNVHVAIINYNGEKTLRRTIESLYNSKDVNVDVYVFDDFSSDNAINEIRKLFPSVKIYVHSHNTRNPNILRNLAINQIAAENIFITDNDIIFDEYCIKNLLEVLESDKNIAACSPRLMYLEDQKRTYFAGVKIHYIGAAIGQYRDEIVDHSEKPITQNSGSGIALIKRKNAIEVGLFDEDYGLAWGDDGDFFHRLLLSGQKCLYVPSAFGYHEYKPFSSERSYRAVGQVTNRLMFIATHYSKRTIILLIPAFILYEFLEFTFMLIKKMPFHFLKGEIEFLKKFELVKTKRKQIQKLRKVSDKKVLYSGKIYISPSLTDGNKVIKTFVELLQKFFHYYWKMIYHFIP